MAQTTLPSDIELEEKPQAMLFDGWDFVPLIQPEPVIRAPLAEGTAESQPA